MYVVKVSSKLLNESLIFSRDLNVVPENWQNHLDSAFENAYIYGRDFISKMVSILIFYEYDEGTRFFSCKR